MTSRTSQGSFETLTHARLRAGQGDVSGAVRILRVVLKAEPGNGEAALLMAELQGRRGPAPPPPDAQTRRERLERWLVKAVARRGVRRAG